jgi:uncharacterized protein (DUF952 family)
LSAPYILHITPGAEWAASTGDLEPESLATEGFVHCSDPGQVLTPANALFAGQSGLILLVVEAARLTAPLVYEDCYASGQAFPHVYGALERAAVVATFAFEPGPDGRFTLPAELAAWLGGRA